MDGNDEFIYNDLKKFPLGYGLLKDNLPNNITQIKEVLESIGITKDYVKVWGSGEVYREFLHVDDMADACVFIMENYSSKEIGEFINIGTGKDLTIKEIAYIIKDLVGFKGEIIFDKTKPEGTPKKQLDVSKLNSLGWQPKIDLVEGIKKVINEY